MPSTIMILIITHSRRHIFPLKVSGTLELELPFPLSVFQATWSIAIKDPCSGVQIITSVEFFKALAVSEAQR